MLTMLHIYSSRIKDLLEANRKLEEKVTDLNSQMANCIQTNKLLIDEHQALQTLYNAHERKLRESQTETDQIVGSLSTLVPCFIVLLKIEMNCGLDDPFITL